jgi:hypothetical protein
VPQPVGLKSAFASPEMPINAKTLPSTFQELTASCSGPSGYSGELTKPRVMSAEQTASLLTKYEARGRENLFIIPRSENATDMLRYPEL